MIGRFQNLAPFHFLFAARVRAVCFRAPTSVAFGSLFLVVGVCVPVAQSGPQTSPAEPSPVVTSESERDVSVRINERLKATWNEHNVTPSKLASEGEWCRRLFLDVLGRIPSAAEVTAFVADRHRSKREKLVDQLLYGERYSVEYVDRWATVWSNLLIGRTGGRDDRGLVNREGLRAYLQQAFSENRPCDQLAVELITATGSNRPGETNFNGAVNFLTTKLTDRATQATARTAQLFMGVQVQCSQCHNHPFNDWKQERFWQLNSFFRQAVALRRFDRSAASGRIRAVELADQDFGGEGETPEEAEVYYEHPNGRLAAAYPVFLDGTPLENRSGFIEDVNRRQALAGFLLESPLLSRAIVNRYWSYFLGYGFTTPVDDMGSHNPTEHQVLLEEISLSFQEQGYDLKQLIRWIVVSRPYALSSRAGPRNQQDDPMRGNPALFSRFYLRQMRPEELYRALATVSYANPTYEKLAKHRPPRDKWLQQFTQALGNDEGDETTSFNGTIPQTLMMFHGRLMQAASATKGDSLLGALLQDTSLNFNQALDRMYWAALARKPTAKERRVAAQLAAKQNGADGAWREALSDMWWALLNSNEFILNH